MTFPELLFFRNRTNGCYVRHMLKTQNRVIRLLGYEKSRLIRATKKTYK